MSEMDSMAQVQGLTAYLHLSTTCLREERVSYGNHYSCQSRSPSEAKASRVLSALFRFHLSSKHI